MLELSHKKLKAWQKSILLLPLVYDCCKKLPSEEKYNLCSQMKSAGLSISNNLAEGSARRSKPDKNRFFVMARASAVEVDNCLTACIVLKFSKKSELLELNAALLEVFKLICGLIDSNEE